MLQQVYSSVQGPVDDRAREGIPVPEDLRAGVPAYAEDAATRDRLEPGHAPAEKWTKSRDRFLHLRFARLCYYLRVRRPDAVIGYSIFVYRLSAEEVRAATAGSLREWSALIERSGDGG
jgi:hypothetical protein